MTGRASRAVLAGLALLVSVPALAVGLGPLEKAGLTDGAEKAFWLTLLNSDTRVQSFHVYALSLDWQPVGGVSFEPEEPRLAPGRQRKFLTIIHGLQPGESRTVRVCAEPVDQEGPIHARVCSKLVARRVVDPGPGTGAGDQQHQSAA